MTLDDLLPDPVILWFYGAKFVLWAILAVVGRLLLRYDERHDRVISRFLDDVIAWKVRTFGPAPAQVWTAVNGTYEKEWRPWQYRFANIAFWATMSAWGLVLVAGAAWAIWMLYVHH